MLFKYRLLLHHTLKQVLRMDSGTISLSSRKKFFNTISPHLSWTR